MKNDNLPIHPLKADLGQEQSIHYFGLTKREYFAGLAMQAILSNEELRIACMADAKILGVSRDEAVARYSVMEADELLKQLEQ